VARCDDAYDVLDDVQTEAEFAAAAAEEPTGWHTKRPTI
jgi:hypothetical protein